MGGRTSHMVSVKNRGVYLPLGPSGGCQSPVLPLFPCIPSPISPTLSLPLAVFFFLTMVCVPGSELSRRTHFDAF